MFCGNCGKVIDNNATVCPFCGSEVVEITSSGFEGVSIASTNLEDGKIVTEKKKSSKSPILIIVVAALLVIGALVAVIIVQNNKLNKSSGGSDEKENITMKEIEAEHVAGIPDEETTTESEENQGTTVQVVTQVVEVTNVSGEVVTEVVTEIVTQKPTTTQSPKPMTTQPPKQETTTKKPASTSAKKPATKSEIVNYFNTAVNGVKSGAKSIEQKYVTNYLGGAAVIGSSMEGIYKMLGGDAWLDDMLQDNSRGAATYSGSDIKAKFPVENQSWASKLTVDDVESASFTESNGIYTITIKTKADAKSTSVSYGSGHNPKVFSLPLPEVINANIPGIAKDVVGGASMNYPSGTIVIQVNASTGKVITASYDAHWTINFDKAGVGVVLPLATKSAYNINW